MEHLIAILAADRGGQGMGLRSIRGMAILNSSALLSMSIASAMLFDEAMAARLGSQRVPAYMLDGATP